LQYQTRTRNPRQLVLQLRRGCDDSEVGEWARARGSAQRAAGASAEGEEGGDESGSEERKLCERKRSGYRESMTQEAADEMGIYSKARHARPCAGIHVYYCTAKKDVDGGGQARPEQNLDNQPSCVEDAQRCAPQHGLGSRRKEDGVKRHRTGDLGGYSGDLEITVFAAVALGGVEAAVGAFSAHRCSHRLQPWNADELVTRPEFRGGFLLQFLAMRGAEGIPSGPSAHGAARCWAAPPRNSSQPSAGGDVLALGWAVSATYRPSRARSAGEVA